jgi:hypothetical protein
MGTAVPISAAGSRTADRLVRFHHFSGDGDIIADVMAGDPSAVRAVQAAHEGSGYAPPRGSVTAESHS